MQGLEIKEPDVTIPENVKNKSQDEQQEDPEGDEPKETAQEPRLPWVAPREEQVPENQTTGSNQVTYSSYYRIHLWEISARNQFRSSISSSRKELENWNNLKAYIKVDRSSVPVSANLIGSHAVSRRKPSGTVKARICPQVNRDLLKGQLRTDAPCMSEETFRLLVSIAAEKKWIIAEIDVSKQHIYKLRFP